VSHNPSVAKNYNATSSLVRFANENIFLLFWNNTLGSLLQHLHCSNSEVAGLAPGP
jgi:hypothetical protein